MSSGDKFLSILGFAKRSGKVIYGYDNLKQSKRPKILVVSDSASGNLMDGMCRLSVKLKVPLVVAKKLEDLVGGGNCKALGVTDVNMASGMLAYFSGEQSQYGIISAEDRIG